jgi:hypothetical protein
MSSIHGKFQNVVTILVVETDKKILKVICADRRIGLRWILNKLEFSYLCQDGVPLVNTAMNFWFPKTEELPEFQSD